jgi:hypothetical protein
MSDTIEGRGVLRLGADVLKDYLHLRDEVLIESAEWDPQRRQLLMYVRSPDVPVAYADEPLVDVELAALWPLRMRRASGIE